MQNYAIPVHFTQAFSPVSYCRSGMLSYRCAASSTYPPQQLANDSARAPAKSAVVDVCDKPVMNTSADEITLHSDQLGAGTFGHTSGQVATSILHVILPGAVFLFQIQAHSHRKRSLPAYAK